MPRKWFRRFAIGLCSSRVDGSSWTTQQRRSPRPMSASPPMRRKMGRLDERLAEAGQRIFEPDVPALHAMRIVAISKIRNEADILEAFVRYHAGIEDRMITRHHTSAANSAENPVQLKSE